mgnify:CR=1 FL=1
MIYWKFGRGTRPEGCECDARFTCGVCLSRVGPTR